MELTLYRISQAGFLLLTLVFVALLIREFAKGVALTSWTDLQKKNYIRRRVIVVILWGLFVSAWSLSGRMEDFSTFPFNILPVILVPIIAAVFFISSHRTGEVLGHIPPANLIRLQSFRFGVEVLLWLLFIADRLPVQMTFEGANYDILAGFTAPVVALLFSRRQMSLKAVIVWNIVCLALLLNIVTIAILSTPSPLRAFTNEPANYVVTYFPISWLPGLLVPLAYYLHFLSIRQMVAMQKGVPSRSVSGI